MAIKKLITIDDHVIKLLDEILSKKKFISSENMDIAISIISIKDCKKATLMAAKALINELNPTKKPKPTNTETVNIYKKYAYICQFLNLSLKGEKNVKSRLQPLWSKIRF